MQIRALLLVAIFFLCASLRVLASDHVVVGESVRVALKRFDTLNIFYSEHLLPQELTVQAVPDPELSPAQQVDVILAPYGLALVIQSGAVVYVTRRAVEASTGNKREAERVIAAEDAIEEIIVSASYRLERGSLPQQLSRHELTLLPATGGDTLRSLQVLPGVASDGLSAKHHFRGGNDDEVLYRLDDFTLYEAFHFVDSQNLFSAVNPNIVESADVYVSGFPARYGTRMSGVVNLNLTEPQQPIETTVDVNMLAASAHIMGRSGNWSWLLSARRSLIGEVLGLIDSSGEENLDTPTFNDQLLRVGWAEERHELFVGVLLSDEALDVEQEDTGERGQGSYRYQSVWANWDYAWSDRVSMKWRLNWFDGDRTRSGATEREFDSEGFLNESRKFSVLSVGNEWHWTPDAATRVTGGWSYARHQADSEVHLSASYGPLGLPIQGAPVKLLNLAFSNSGPNSNAYASLSRDLSESLTVTVGLRYDYQDIDGAGAGEWSGRLSLKYSPWVDGSFDLDLGRYVQQQFIYEMDIDEGQTELFDPQYSDQINIGGTWIATDTVQARVQLFHRVINDPWPRYDNLYNRVVLLPELHADRYLIRASDARVSGLEMALSASDGALAWNVSYSYSVAEERVSGIWHKRSWDQPHVFKGGVSWNGAQWRIGASFVYRDGWPITGLVAQPEQLPGKLNRERLDDYFSLDIHVGRIFESALGQFEVYLDITNLTDSDNVGGHLYQADLTVAESDLLPIIPALGVRWTWP